MSKILPFKKATRIQPDERSNRLHILVEVFIRGCRAIGMTNFMFRLIKNGKVYTVRMDEEDSKPIGPA